ncbi:MAG TPA: hypothetical protein VF297_06145 [Pyrinomonadaceae bacterium]
MKIFKSRATKAAALALAAVLQVYAAGGFAFAAPEGGTVATAAPRQTQGRLTTTGDNPVVVNGNNARTGDTVFSGQQIRTPAGTTATVQLPGLGGVEIRPGSNVTLTFGDGQISVVVISGCVRLSADAGVKGTVQSNGRTRTTDDDDRVIDTCDNAGAVPVGTASATAGGLGTGASTALTVGLVGAFGLIANQLISDSDNPEPTDCTPIPGTTSPLTPPSGCTP